MIDHKVGEFSRTIHIGVVANQMTVADVLAFADKLREADVASAEQITADHSNETRHLTGLRVHYSEKLQPAGGQS